jgi:hypothetical protein
MDYSLNISKLILLIILLSILGLNVFNYLSKATDAIGTITKSGISTGLEGVKKTVSLTGEGTKTISDKIGAGITDIENALDIKIIDEAIPDNQANKKLIQDGYCYIGTD